MRWLEAFPAGRNCRLGGKIYFRAGHSKKAAELARKSCGKPRPERKVPAPGGNQARDFPLNHRLPGAKACRVRRLKPFPTAPSPAFPGSTPGLYRRLRRRQPRQFCSLARNAAGSAIDLENERFERLESAQFRRAKKPGFTSLFGRHPDVQLARVRGWPMRFPEPGAPSPSRAR